MNINSLLTASVDKFIPGMKGATLANYVEFKDFVKDADGQIIGSKLYDRIANKEYIVKSKVVVNCGGIFGDNIRLKDNPNATPRI